MVEEKPLLNRDNLLNGIATLGSYLTAFGAGMGQGGNVAQGLANGMTSANNHMQNIRSFNAYKPYFEQMGINADALNPAKGGPGFGNTNPTQIAQIGYMNAYRNAMLNQRANEMAKKYMPIEDVARIRGAIEKGDLSSLDGMDLSPQVVASLVNYKPESTLKGIELTDKKIKTEEGKPALQEAQIEALKSGIPIKQQQANIGGFNAVLNGVESGVLDPNSVSLPSITNNFQSGSSSVPTSLPSNNRASGNGPIKEILNISELTGGTPIPLRGNSAPGPKINPNYQPKTGTNKSQQAAVTKAQTDLAAINTVKSQLDRFEKSFGVMPSKSNMYTAGMLREKTGMRTPGEQNFEAQRTLLFNKIARDLGGEKGVLSDGDIARIQASLPSLYDSKAQKEAKMKAIYALLNDNVNKNQKMINVYTQQGQTQKAGKVF